MACFFRVILVLIAYAIRNSINMRAHLSSETRGLMLVLGLQPLQCIMHAISKGFGEVVQNRRLV